MQQKRLPLVCLPERAVERGRSSPAAGASSRTDMGLVLVERMLGREQAELVQLLERCNLLSGRRDSNEGRSPW
jgi:hypothetical protein